MHRGQQRRPRSRTPPETAAEAVRRSEWQATSWRLVELANQVAAAESQLAAAEASVAAEQARLVSLRQHLVQAMHDLERFEEEGRPWRRVPPRPQQPSLGQLRQRQERQEPQQREGQA